MDFNGTPGSVLQLGPDPDWQVPAGTIAFSFTPANTGGQQGLFAKDASFFGNGGHTTIYLDGSTLIVRFQDTSTSAELSFGGIASGEEYEIAATFGPDGVELWVDGNLVDSDALPVSWEGNQEWVQWGGRGWGSSSGAAGFDAPFNGTIADKQIYDAVLNASQIAALANSSSATNNPPDAVDDTVVTDEDNALTIQVADLLANDSDPDDDTPVFVGIATQPSNGSVVNNNDGTLTYTPAPDFNGADSFDVTISDGIGGLSQSTVSVTVNPVNDDPVAVNDSSTTIVDAPVVIDVTANDLDADGDDLIITEVTDGALGSVASNGDGTVTYTPNAGATGNDTFTYTISDGQGGPTSEATVSVSILSAPNNPPVAANDDIEVNEDGSVTFQPGTNDLDDDGDTIVASAIATSPSNGSAVVNGDGTVTYTSAGDFNGGDSFIVEVTDGNGGFDTSTVNVTVLAENDQPVALDDSASTGQGEPVIIDVLGNDFDIDGDILSIDSVTDGGNGSVSISGDTVIYTPNAGFEGEDSFTYTVTDGDLTDTATVTVDVTSFPDPIAEFADATFNGSSAGVIQTPPDAAWQTPVGTIAFAFTASDTNGPQGLFSKDASFFAAGGHTAIYLDGNTLIARFQDTSTSAVLSFGGISANQQYKVAATFGPDGVELWVDGNLVDSDALPVSWAGNGEWVQWGGRGWGSASGAPGFDAPFEGEIADRQIYGVKLDASQIAELHADGPVNNDPVAVNDAIIVDEDASIAFDPAENDADVDGDTVVANAIASGPANGTAVVDTISGLVTYTPDADFFGFDSFDIEVTDGNGGFDVSTVSVTVNAIEDDPVANDDTAAVEVGNAITIDVLANDIDADGDTLLVESADFVSANGGTIANNGDGTLTYTPAALFIGEDTFDYVVSDGDGPTDTATVTVTVSEVPVLPDPVFEQPGAKTYSGGSGQVDNYAPNAALNIAAGTVAFSFIDQNPSVRQGLVVKDASFFGDGGHFSAYIDEGDLKVRFQDETTSSVLEFQNIAANQEYEVAALFSQDGVALYVDGTLVDQDLSLGMDWLDNDEWLQVGGLGWGSNAGSNTFTNPFSGQIADVEIYDERLDTDQIQVLADQSSIVDLGV